MIEPLLSILKPIDAPGSIEFLWLSLAIGFFVMFIWPRSLRWGRNWIAGVALLYLCLALPLTAKAIAGQLPPIEPEGTPTPDLLVIFDGDNRRGRIQAAARVFKGSTSSAVWVLGLEARWFEPELPSAGIPAEVLHFETTTLNTRDQLQWVLAHRNADPAARIAIVASRLQTPRIAGMMRALGLSGISLVSAPIDTEPPVAGPAMLLPVYSALRVSRDALYEHMALAYYRRNGWAR